MKGLDLHRELFEERGRPLLAQAFPREFPQLAVASVGFGSDRLAAARLGRRALRGTGPRVGAGEGNGE